jgi:ubiquinone/menaquinone biosynthesis C-methylase UbiE
LKPSSHNPTLTFFDRVAPDYNRKWQHPYLRHFFLRRMELATTGFSPRGKRILDIGAGTGWLYDYLKEPGEELDYLGLDISENMLRESKIPANRRITGNILELALPPESFDALFALGLTTYLKKKELALFMNKLNDLLRPGGSAVLSFTNPVSLDVQFRKGLGFFSFLFSQNTLAGAGLSRNAYAPARVRKALPESLTLNQVQYFSPTLPFLSNLSPKTAACWSPWLENLLGNTFLFPFLATDFMVFLKKKEIRE